MGNTESKNLGIEERVGVKSGIPTESKLKIAKDAGKNLKARVANPNPNTAKIKSRKILKFEATNPPPEIFLNASQNPTPGVVSVLCQ